MPTPSITHCKIAFATLLCACVIAEPSAQAEDNGQNVNDVACAAGGEYHSTFTSQGPSGPWIQETASGRRTSWQQAGRDAWSVYLQQAGRNVQVQLDLHTRKVTLRNPRRGARQLCTIVATSAQRPVASTPRPQPRPQPVPKPQPVPRPQPQPVPRPQPQPVPDDPVVRLPRVSERQTQKLVNWVVTEAGRLEQPACWKKSKPNTAGKPLTQCPSNKEKNGALCYPKCKKGYKGVGPVCWSSCPKGFTDTGAHCLKPKAYGRGAGYPWKFGDKAFSLNGARKRCKKRHGKCEKHGEIIYPKCKSGFKPAGCCICSPKCPKGMRDIGVSCEKKSYGRTAGTPLTCRSDQVLKGALCYPKCPSGYDHGGPVCWKRCESGHPVNCGAMCGQSTAVCALAVTNMVLATGELMANIAGAALTGGAANASLKAAKTAAKTGAKVAARVALKNAVRSAGKTIARKLQKRLGARVINYAARKSGRRAGEKLAKDYAQMVLERAAQKIALAQASSDPDLREIATMVDPTGVMEVVNAFDKPLCVATPLP